MAEPHVPSRDENVAQRAADVGARLASLRATKGIDLGAISAHTKIPVHILEAIDRGDLQRLPAGLFRRGHVRAYAREVGLDGDEIVQEIWGSTPVESALPDYRLSTPAFDDPPTQFRDLIFRTAAAAAALALVFVFARSRVTTAPPGPVEGGVATSGTATAGSVTTATEGVASPAPTSLAPALSAPAIPAPASPPPAGPAAPPDELQVVLHATNPVWIQASADGRRIAYGTLAEGSNTTLTAHAELLLRVGDAGGIDYTVNGLQGRSLGGRGQVRDLRITPANAATFAKK
jgi:cytoskeletal protein RodZ